MSEQGGKTSFGSAEAKVELASLNAYITNYETAGVPKPGLRVYACSEVLAELRSLTDTPCREVQGGLSVGDLRVFGDDGMLALMRLTAESEG